MRQLVEKRLPSRRSGMAAASRAFPDISATNFPRRARADGGQRGEA
jgi:hypothetical protein